MYKSKEIPKWTGNSGKNVCILWIDLLVGKRVVWADQAFLY